NSMGGAVSTNFYFDVDKIHCFPNLVPGMIPVSPRPLCTPVNNVHHCQAFPVIKGNVFNDNNSNGIKDPSENYRANIQLQLSNGLSAFTNSNGYYELSADTGSFVLSVIAPSYYNAVPAAVNYSFSNYD